MFKVDYLAKVKEEDFIYFKGADISVFGLGKEIYRIIRKFNLMMKTYDEENTETCVRENAKWILETLGYIRQLNMEPSIYNIKQLDNIWKDYKFARTTKDLVKDCLVFDEEFFEEGHVEQKLVKHLSKLEGKTKIDLEFVAFSKNDNYDKIWKYLAEGIKANKYYISDLISSENTDEYCLYYFANALVHNNFRVDKYVTNRNSFFESLYNMLLDSLYNLIEEYNEYVDEHVALKNKYWNPQVEIYNYLSTNKMDLI